MKTELKRTKIGTKETAVTLGCSEKTLRNKLSAGSPDVPPHYQIFGRRLWDIEELRILASPEARGDDRSRLKVSPVRQTPEVLGRPQRLIRALTNHKKELVTQKAKPPVCREASRPVKQSPDVYDNSRYIDARQCT